MALSASDLQAQLDALRTARARGVRVIEYAGQRVEYRSDSEMAAADADLVRRLASANGAGVVRGYYPIVRKGL